MNIKIVSGGQTGVDQGALEAAVGLGMDFGGWAPARWLAERGGRGATALPGGMGGGRGATTLPGGQGGGRGATAIPGIPEVYRGKMKEYPDQGSNAQNYRARTKANVRDSHATLILAERLPLEGGTKLTRDFAVTIGRSHHVVDLSAANAKADALAWLRQFSGMSSALVLNVAGPRESKAPGIQAKTKAFLSELLWEV